MTACTQPGCTGNIVDGYCDVCGSPGSGRQAQGASGNSCTQPGCTGTIVDGNQDTSNFLARGLTLNAAGAIGDASDTLETSVMTFQATTTNGGVFISETDSITVTSVTAV